MGWSVAVESGMAAERDWVVDVSVGVWLGRVVLVGRDVLVGLEVLVGRVVLDGVGVMVLVGVKRSAVWVMA